MKFAKISLLIGLGFGAPLAEVAAAPPIVTNVVASQRSGTKLVDIHYDVFDADNDPLKIRVEVSHNGGVTYQVPVNSLSGDAGSNVLPGTNKLIVWNAGVDWDGEYSPQMRVRVSASDSRGYPGLEWGQEVPPGGFLMGRDGGAEGVGPAKHVNISWSYWLSKYEITVQQYVDFLNIAIITGEVTRSGNNVNTTGSYAAIPNNSTIYNLGADIQWNLNKFESVVGRSNLPVAVNWYGAFAFVQHFGYDLPTDAEWEKAARGYDFDGLGEHRVYPWGNSIAGHHANFSGSGHPFQGERTPVGYYNGNQIPAGTNMANQYGLYDVIGNVAEWTRTLDSATESYPAQESLTNSIHVLSSSNPRIMRGGSYVAGDGSSDLKLYGRNPTGVFQSSGVGFRVIRRSP